MNFDVDALQRLPLREPETKGLAANESRTLTDIIWWTICGVYTAN
ncbi:ALQxL family class IV lanthipeptide [Sphaerisporangium viridialbum]